MAGALGTAPDSWGVWFPDDSKQLPWHQFLDEAAAAGYTAVELGPFGYLSISPERLRDELGRRGLTLTGATAGTALHRGPPPLTDALAECRPAAALLAAPDAPYLITLPVMYTDLCTGELVEPAELTAQQWATLGHGHSELGRVLHDEHGVRQMFHPHADAHVDTQDRIHRFLELTEPPPCPSASTPATSPTPAATTGPSSPATPTGSATSTSNPSTPTSWRQGVRRPHVFRPSRPTRRHGRTDPRQTGHATTARRPQRPRRPLFAIVEHDMYPAPPGTPLPIATRTQRYYRHCGVRTAGG